MKKISMLILFTFMAVAVASDSHAVPSLDVGSAFDYVNVTDAYQTYWGSSIPRQSGEDGFLVGPSGYSLHVFTNISGADIYPLTTADIRSGNGITFRRLQVPEAGAGLLLFTGLSGLILWRRKKRLE